MNYVSGGNLKTPECHLYKTWELFKYNFFIWTTAYFIGLQFTHLDQGIFQQLTLDWNIMKNWPLILWVIFIGLVLLLVTIVTYIFYLYYLIGYLSAYLTFLSAFFGVMVFFSKWYGLFGYHLHLHHWFLGAFMQAFLCYQNGFITAVQAIFGGVQTEGGSRWGYDPLFVGGNGLMNAKSAAAMTKLAQSQARASNNLLAELRA